MDLSGTPNKSLWNSSVYFPLNLVLYTVLSIMSKGKLLPTEINASA